MTTFMSSLHNAIDESIRTGQTVTVTIDSESDLQKAFGELLEAARATCDHIDYVDATATLREVWGWDDDSAEGEMTWRVHLMQSERAGAVRHHE
jgi:hypothetical protein